LCCGLHLLDGIDGGGLLILRVGYCAKQPERKSCGYEFLH
jgi:hypothetical protein